MSVVERVHHIGIAVADLEAAEHVVRDQLGLRLVRRHAPAGGRVRAAFYDAGNVELELLWQAEPSGSTFLGGAPQARVEHVALQVRDLGQAIAALRALGVALAPSREGPIGASARTVAVSSGGITYQVLQLEQSVEATPGEGRAALEHAYGALLPTLSGLDDEDGWQTTRCSGWVVRDLVQHLLDDARRGLVALHTRAGGPADVDAVTYWRAWQPGTRGADAGRRATRTIASAWPDLVPLVDTYLETARAVLAAAGERAGDTLVATQGHVLTIDDLLRTLAVEATVHQLDLRRGEPSSGGLTEVRRVLDGLLGHAAPIPDAVRYALIGTGRETPTTAERSLLGGAVDGLPLFG